MGSPFQYGQQPSQAMNQNPGSATWPARQPPMQGVGGQQPRQMQIMPYPGQSQTDDIPPIASGTPQRPLGFPTAGANSPVPYGQFRGVSPYSPARNY